MPTERPAPHFAPADVDAAPATGSLTPDAPAFATDAVTLARNLIGGFFALDGVGGTIVETEAYDATDPASHSFRGPTPRNAVMFGPVGRLYVYRSYGIHWCANIVCGTAGGGSAVLLRALLPTVGVGLMRDRRGTDRLDLLCSGPGRLTQALGINAAHNGASFGDGLFLALPSEPQPAHATPRIGITKGVETPWRFVAGAAPRRRRHPSALA
ncbi:MAG: DNA-3-methyladenine glycosylase [Bauldia sp.]